MFQPVPKDAPSIVKRALPFSRTWVDAGGGVELSVVDDGPEDADETVVYLHGNPAWSFLYRNLIPDTLEAGHRVVVPDMAGMGLSDKPEDPDYHTLEQHVRNLEAVAEQLNVRDATLVMHDWGGPIGMGLATRQPERIARLVVANTLAFPPRTQRPLSLFHKAFASPLGYQANLHLNAVLEVAFRGGVRDRLPKAVLDAYRWPFKEKGARIAAARMVQMVPNGPEHPSAITLAEVQDRYSRLVDRPMLVLWADADPVMRPKLAQKWTEHFPKAELVHVSDTAKHFWQEDEPDAFLRRVLAFVAG